MLKVWCISAIDFFQASPVGPLNEWTSRKFKFDLFVKISAIKNKNNQQQPTNQSIKALFSFQPPFFKNAPL